MPGVMRLADGGRVDGTSIVLLRFYLFQQSNGRRKTLRASFGFKYFESH
jgi:hypothetical protein